MRRRRVFLRRESAPERGRAIKVFWIRESGTELRRRNSITHREMSVSIFPISKMGNLRSWNWDLVGRTGKNSLFLLNHNFNILNFRDFDFFFYFSFLNINIYFSQISSISLVLIIRRIKIFF